MVVRLEEMQSASPDTEPAGRSDGPKGGDMAAEATGLNMMAHIAQRMGTTSAWPDVPKGAPGRPPGGYVVSTPLKRG